LPGENVVADILSDHVLTLATAIGTFLAAIAAWGSAFLSKQANQVAAHAAQAAADAAQATLYRSLQQEYASREIHDAMRRLSEWYWRFEDRGLDFASEWKERWETEPEVRWLRHADGSHISSAQSLISTTEACFPSPLPAV
jgi:type VI protein secretion system component VasK